MVLDFGGAALGAAFGELFRAVSDATRKATKFKSILDGLHSTLISIDPVFVDIEELNRELDRCKEETKMFTDRLIEAKKLVQNCSKIKWWNFGDKALYAEKLLDLEKRLLTFFQINVQALQFRDGRAMLVGFNQVHDKLDHISSSLGSGGQAWDRSVSLLGSCGAPEAPDLIVGLDEPLQELKTLLLKDGVSVVVLSASGGCGKTTLAKMLCHDHKIEGKFAENIFYVTVSKTPNLKVIIQKLYEHKGYRVPEFQNDEDAVNQWGHLLKKLQPRPVLLVLDDVWSGSESLIEKFKFKFPEQEYKILITSRSVLPIVDSTTYTLKLLNNKDATALFHHSAFPQDGNSHVPDELVNEIVRGCGGFPLALTVVGRSLYRQPYPVWKITLKQWSEGPSIFSNGDLLICLRASLDALDERVKECYLDLGSFPEDQRIPVTALMDMWVELYNLDEDNALANLHRLSTRNLLNTVFTWKDANEVDDYYNDHCVTQHDLLRELAIHQSSQEPIEQTKRLIMDIRGNDLPKWSSEQMQQPFHARLLSISTDETFSSSWFNLQLPEVEALILNFRARNYTLPEFMEKMDQLKVLIVINYDFCPAELSNFPLLGSLSSLKRIRLEHVSISSLSTILQLRNLHKISLIMCEIGEAFRNFTAQIPHMLPNLLEIDIDCCDDLVELPAGFCDIVHLKKLSITKCHKLCELPEGFGKLANLEVLRLHACTELLELPESIANLHKLSFLDVSDCLNMKEMPIQMGELCGLTSLNMRGCERLFELPPSVMGLGQLKNVKCDEYTANLWEPYKIHLTNLKINVLKEDNNLNWLCNLHL